MADRQVSATLAGAKAVFETVVIAIGLAMTVSFFAIWLDESGKWEAVLPLQNLEA